MKPVRCKKIAVGECEVLSEAPQGSQAAWSRISMVLLSVNSQHQLGCLAKTPLTCKFRCGDSSGRDCSFTPTEGCVRVANFS